MNRTTRLLGLSLIASIGLLAAPVMAQTTNSTSAGSGPTLKDVLNATNIFAIPYLNYSTKSHDVGGGIAIGYRVSDFAAAVIRADDWKGKFYTASFGVSLQPPQTWLGKIPVVPVAYTGVETPVSGGASVSTDAFVGVGGYINFKPLLGDNWFTRHVEVVGTYETHFALPEAERRQVKFGPIVKFSF